jgi:hypothetical protein
MDGIFAAVLTSATTLGSCATRCVLYILFSGIYRRAESSRSADHLGSRRPTDYQAAINASTDQDTIFVRPGVYFENIKFLGSQSV